MKRLAVVAAGVALSFLAFPSSASACMKCKFKLDCVTDPDCIIILVCESVPSNGYMSCESDGAGSCGPGPRCWYVLQRPAADGTSELLASLFSSGAAVSDEICGDGDDLL